MNIQCFYDGEFTAPQREKAQLICSALRTHARGVYNLPLIYRLLYLRDQAMALMQELEVCGAWPSTLTRYSITFQGYDYELQGWLTLNIYAGDAHAQR